MDCGLLAEDKMLGNVLWSMHVAIEAVLCLGEGLKSDLALIYLVQSGDRKSVV